MVDAYINNESSWMADYLPERLGRSYWSGRLYRFLKKTGMYQSNQYSAQTFTREVTLRLIARANITPTRMLLWRIHDELISRWNRDSSIHTKFCWYGYEKQFKKSFFDCHDLQRGISNLPHTPVLWQIVNVGGMRRDGSPRLGIRLKPIRDRPCVWCGEATIIEFQSRGHRVNGCLNDICRDINIFLSHSHDVRGYRTIDPNAAKLTPRKGLYELKRLRGDKLYWTNVLAAFLNYSATVALRSAKYS